MAEKKKIETKNNNEWDEGKKKKLSEIDEYSSNIFSQWHIQVTYFLNNVIFHSYEAIKEKRNGKTPKITNDNHTALRLDSFAQNKSNAE